MTHEIPFTARRPRWALFQGDMMPGGDEYRQLVVKLIDANPRTGRPNHRFEESWETLLLGLASTAIGFTLLFVVFQGMRGNHVSGFHVEKPAESRAGGATIRYYTPSRRSAIAGVLGECVGLAGIVAGRWRRAATSILCVLGTAVCLLHMVLIYVQIHFLT